MAIAFITSEIPMTLDLREILACPRCRHEGLNKTEGNLSCPSCGELYPLVDNIPVCVCDAAERKAIMGSGSPPVAGKEKFYNDRELITQFLCHQEVMENLEQLKHFIPIPVPGPVLEIGSGNGMFQDMSEQYVALDYSLVALREFIAPWRPRICGSAEILPFRDSVFDLVFTRATLEHVPRPDRAFAEILRVLKPGGMGYVFPAWNCRQWNCDGIPVRPYHDLNWPQKLTKLSLPLRESLIWRVLLRFPWRLFRVASHFLKPRPTELKYKSLRPDYEKFWMSDSDACSCLDSCESVLYYRSRGCPILHPGTSLLRQLFLRYEPIIFQKPESPDSLATSCD